MRLWLSCVVLLLLAAMAHGQAHTDTLRRDLAPLAGISADRLGFVYLADQRGGVYKLDSSGKSLLHFSPRQPANITLIEAWQGVRVLLFYREWQQVIYLDRLLADTPPLSLNIPSVQFSGFYRLACPSLDDRLWALEETTLELQKLDLQGQRILQRSPLQLVLPNREIDLVFMREYQNQLYLVLRNKGILIFDNLGNYRRALPYTGLQSLAFTNEWMVIPQQDKVVLAHSFLMTQTEVPWPGMTAATPIAVVGSKLVWAQGRLLLGRSVSVPPAAGR